MVDTSSSTMLDIETVSDAVVSALSKHVSQKIDEQLRQHRQQVDAHAA